MASSAQKTIQTIESFLSQVEGTVKTAAEANTEAGSIGGPTEHPIKNVDDRTQPAKEGFRSKENDKDVKEEIGPPSVDSSDAKVASFDAMLSRFAAGTTKRAEGAVNPGGTAEDDATNIGTKVAPTGEDPANETSKAKGGKDDPGSTHPARTDNNELDGCKYAYDSNTSVEKMASMMTDLGNQLCASIGASGQHAQNNGTIKTASVEADSNLAFRAGWEVLGLTSGTFDKAAADQLVQNELYGLVKSACETADKTADYYDEYFNEMNKQAEGEEGEGGGQPPDPSMAGGGDPGAAPGGGSPDGMMSALGGGASGGLDGSGGGGGEDAEAQTLSKALESLGITPEEFAQAVQAQQGGGAPPGDPSAGGGAPPDPSMGAGSPPPGPGGMPPGAGGPPPGPAGMPPDASGPTPPPGGMEVQGSFHPLTRREKIAAMTGVIREITERSRRAPAR